MMRKCHLNTCPVGVATQDPELRKRFTGNADHVVNLFRFLTEELREIMAELGFRTVTEMVGQSDYLEVRNNITHWKYSQLNLEPILYKEPASLYTGLYKQEEQDHLLTDLLDWRLVESAQPALLDQIPVQQSFQIKNTDRATGTLLSNELTRKYPRGLPENTIHFKFNGTAGQSFGAFNARGIRLELEGDANDYFGKGLSGATLIVYPPGEGSFIAEENIIIGNVALYGATSGAAYIRGKAGERFAVRNSGASVVVEGVGDHGCEYMTGGIVVVLGQTGNNFAAGMSGGIAFVYNVDGQFSKYCNPDMVLLEQSNEDDLVLLKQFIQQHFQYTGSTVAKFVLEDFDNQLRNFIKVIPVDYKKALSKMNVVKEDVQD